MKNIRFLAALLAALTLALSACGGTQDDTDDLAGGDWRTTGVVRAEGTITRDGGDVYVLVCVNKKASNFYYDTDGQTLFDGVEYPPALAEKVALSGDVWGMFKGIDFADLNGDGNSDVTMKFDDGGNELLMVWFWDTESEKFVYQPEESQLGEYDDGRGDLVPDDGDAVPVLMSDALPFTNMETQQLENHEDGTYYYEDVAEDGLIIVVNTVLPRNLVDDSQTSEDYLTDCALDLRKAETYDLQTVEKNDAYSEKMSYPVYIVTYTSGENEDTREWTVFAMDTDRYTYLYGLCVTLDAADDVKSVYQDIFAGLYLSDGEDDYDLDSEVYHRDISEFQGTWYYDNDLAAEMFIVIDGHGNWSYYQRAPGDPEATEMDRGTFSYATDEFGTYYADSTMYNGVRFRMYDQDEGVLLWDEDTYYRLER